MLRISNLGVMGLRSAKGIRESKTELSSFCCYTAEEIDFGSRAAAAENPILTISDIRLRKLAMDGGVI
jgi:hypothetical protein